MGYDDLVNAPHKRDSFLDQLLNPRQQDGQVVTVVAVTTMTAAKTFSGSAVYVTQTNGDGQAIAGGAVFASRSSDPTAAASSTLVAEQSSTVAAVSSATATTPLVTSATLGAVTSSLTGAQKTAAAKSSDNGGLSGGAKAGIAFGVLIPLAALLIGALIFMRRKKQKGTSGERLDDEKANVSRPDALPAFPAPGAAQGSVRSTDNLAAPRLSLRPQTQFDPRMSKLEGPGARGLGNGALAAGAVGAGAMGAAAMRNHSPSPQSAYDRPGAEKNANNPANPFGNHAETYTNNSSPVAPRAPSPGHIDAADFPLPHSVAPSEKAISLRPDASTDNLSMAPSNPATHSNLSLAGPSNGAMVAGAAVAGGAVLAAATSKRNTPPPTAETVFRVQLDFKPSMEDELEIRAGQLVRCIHEYDDGWALCARMDRSQQGVVPRTCLSKAPVKPRQGPPPPQGRQAPGPAGSPQMRGPPGQFNQQGRPMTPQGRNSPAPYGQPPRAMTPNGRNSPAPFGQQPRPMSPAGMGQPGGRQRAQSNAAPYAQYNPQARSMSPGPYGNPNQMRPPQRPDQASRPRSNSMSNMNPVNVKPLSPSGSQVNRKPVPGMAV